MPAGERLAEQDHGAEKLQGRIDVAQQSGRRHRQAPRGVAEEDQRRGRDRS